MHRWQVLLNLCDWRLMLASAAANKGAMAQVDISVQDMWAAVHLGDFGSEGVTSENLESTAVHELLHVRLKQLIAFARDPNTSDEHLLALEHGVINAIEPLLMGLTRKD